jgi:hypothetical protein
MLLVQSSPARPTNNSSILLIFLLYAAVAALAGGCRRGQTNFGLCVGDFRRLSPNFAPCLWRRVPCFRRRGGQVPRETPVRDVRARGGADGDKRQGSAKLRRKFAAALRGPTAHVRYPVVFVRASCFSVARGYRASRKKPLLVRSGVRLAVADPERAIGRRSAAGDP